MQLASHFSTFKHSIIDFKLNRRSGDNTHQILVYLEHMDELYIFLIRDVELTPEKK